MRSHKQQGLTLVEMAIVLAIIGLLVGGSVSVFKGVVVNAHYSSTHAKLAQTKQALLNYVKVNLHLPCPDVEGDGQQNRESDGRCSTVTGVVPYADIGRSLQDSRDEWGNLFVYGVDAKADQFSEISANDGAKQQPEGTTQASYFANQTVIDQVGDADIRLPYFGLKTPVKSGDPVSLSSYRVCKRSALAANCNNPNDYELQSVPAVLVAFNKNGQGVSLLSCNGQAASEQERENCDGDLALTRNPFRETAFDDQIQTISAYEIKQQALDQFNALTLVTQPELPLQPEWLEFDVIYRGNLVEPNLLAHAELGESNRIYIAQNHNKYGSQPENGDLTTAVDLQAGEDMLVVEGNVSGSATVAQMGAGDDALHINGEILKGAQLDGGSGVDRLYLSEAVYSRQEIEQILATEGQSTIANFEYIYVGEEQIVP